MTALNEPIYYSKFGKILMLGEGDFSFTRSLLRYVNNPSAVIATTFESQETLRKHGNASDNVADLQSKGVTVLYSVDATRLADSAGLTGHQFAYIIFNFPHVGGKASVGQNRKLLKALFQSCSAFLDTDGEIHITLCGGQGGTPADKPQREWGNSWQVVAMAAHADLILSQTVTFDPANYPEYTCTGFRSQDKPFFTKGGIIHVFVRSLQIPMKPADIKDMNAVIKGENMVFQCPPSLAEFIDRDLFTEELHPVQIMKDGLMKELTSTYSSVSVLAPDRFSLVVEDCGNVNAYRLDGQISGRDGGVDCNETDIETNTGSVSTKGTHRACDARGDSIVDTFEKLCTDVYNDSSINTSDTVPDQATDSGSFHTCDKSDSTQVYSLRTDLLVHAPAAVKMKDSPFCVTWGQVFSHCTIKPANFPIKHHLLLIAKNSEQSIVKAGIIQSLHSLLGSGIEIEFDDFTEDVTSNYEPWQLVDDKPSGTSIKITKNSETRCVGNFGNLNFADRGIIFANFYLDALAMLTFNFTDIRLLWSCDDRGWNKFKSEVSEVLPDFSFLKNCEITLESFSMYPPMYTHDISLWESPDLPRLQESDFFSVLREICHHQVVDVFLKDQYLHPKTGSRSRCYRMVYVSPDRALSKTMATELQIQFRQALRDRLGVYLR